MALTRPKYSQIYDTDYKQSVRLATTTDVGNLLLTSTITNTVDSTTVAVDDRILVKNQTDDKQNGIYRVVTVGTGSNGTWVRDHDADASDKVTSGLTTSISAGPVNAYSTWKLATADPITLGTTSLTFINPFLSAALVAGSDTMIQFNDTGVVNGLAGLTYSRTPGIFTTGNITATGNLNVSGPISSLGQVRANSGIASTTSGTGALVVIGGAGISGNVYAGNITAIGSININSLNNVTAIINGGTTGVGNIGASGQAFNYGYYTNLVGTIQTIAQTNITSVGNLTSLSASGVIQTTGIVYANAGIASTNTTSGALQVTGGVGISGNINAGNVIATYIVGNGSLLTGLPAGYSNTNVIAYLTTNSIGPYSNANVTSYLPTYTGAFGNITGITSSGTIQTTGALWGNSGVGGTLLTAAQTNITTVGNLTSLSVAGATSIIGIVYGNAGIASTSTTTGALVVTGGIGVTGNINAGNVIATYIVGNGSLLTGLPAGYSNTNVSSYLPTYTGAFGNITGITSSGTIQTTGALWGNSGVGGTLLTASQTNITTVGNLTSLSVAGATSIIGIIYANAGIASTSTTTGALVVNGGVGVTGNINAGNVIATQLTGTLTTASQTAITTVGNLTALSVAGATSHIGIVYANAGIASTTSGTGALVVIGGAGISGNVYAGNITAIGSININSLNNVTAIANGGTAGTGNIGASGQGFNTVFAKATSAQYADLAENYSTDADYKPGTVVIFGGESEITISTISHDSRIAGVISTNPAYHMNSLANGLPVALTGRVPCQVQGPISKGDLVVSSDIPGVGQRIDNAKYIIGCVIGKSLENIVTNEMKVIEVVVGRV